MFGDDGRWFISQRPSDLLIHQLVEVSAKVSDWGCFQETEDLLAAL